MFRAFGVVTIMVLAVITAAPAYAATGPTDSSCAAYATSYPPLPAQVNPLTASADVLAKYGFPHRPAATNQGALDAWETAVSHAKAQELAPDASPCPSGVQHGNRYSNNWSGYGEPSSEVVAGGFDQVSNYWIVPTVAGHSGYTACGVGGSSNAPTASVWGGIGVNQLYSSWHRFLF